MLMGLRDLDLPHIIRTTSSDPIKDFFDPVLECSINYNIAVGYFTTGWLRDAAHGIAKFALNHGQANWIISPELTEDDLIALSNGESLSEEYVRGLISKGYRHLFNTLSEEPREALGWLIADKILNFKIGIPRNELTGLLHTKEALFRDDSGDRVGIMGSYNLTSHAKTNWEAFSVYCDWKSPVDRERNNEMEGVFSDMWQAKDPNLSLYSPSEADIEEFKKTTLNSKKHYLLFKKTRKLSGPNLVQEQIQVPRKYLNERGQLREYQEEGIKEWFKHNGTGILQMATGTGKTVTALKIATMLTYHVSQKGDQILTVVAVPYINLADQWYAEASEFGFTPIRCYGEAKEWRALAQAQLSQIRSKALQQAMFIVVNASLRTPSFQSILKNTPGHLLFIGDEMHHLGSNKFLPALPNEARFKLGLSATPNRVGDDEGSDGLKSYFGDTVLEYGLGRAIENDYLCRYRYHPVTVHLEDDEQEMYDELSLKIARVLAQSKASKDANTEVLESLLRQRAVLIGKARNKLPKLLQLLQEQCNVSHTLVYCGSSNDQGERYIDVALKKLGAELGLHASRFTAEESAGRRNEILSHFASGKLQVLLAIRCLDEGIDVPKTQTAYILASSTNPKEFIQRRGRVLRKAPGKEMANIYDFIVVPSASKLKRGGDNSGDRSLVKRELARFNEFAELAVNHGEALAKMRLIKEQLGLMDQ